MYLILILWWKFLAFLVYDIGYMIVTAVLHFLLNKKNKRHAINVVLFINRWPIDIKQQRPPTKLSKVFVWNELKVQRNAHS